VTCNRMLQYNIMEISRVVPLSGPEPFHPPFPFKNRYVAKLNFVLFRFTMDRLCGLVVRVSGYRSRGPGFDSRRFQVF
jgi:hypothetical protein